MIETGSSDCEILFVTKNTVYYRVYDTLFVARIENEQIENIQQLY